MDSKKLLLLAIVLLLAYTGWQDWKHRPVDDPPPGVLAPDAPQQRPLTQPRQFRLDGYDIEAQARYKFVARLLSREPYYMGREADLSPVDFAIGWGPMSDSAVLKQLDISQSVRYFSLHWQRPPLPAEEIMRHAANTHIIPADSRVAGQLDKMRPGQVIELEGYLVNVAAPDGWRWHTSLTREDTGNGACELFWVEVARIINQ